MPEATFATNLDGTRNTIEAAFVSGCPGITYASSGKALRPYCCEVYAATKRIAEWMLASAPPDLGVGVGRFTHVVDNSIVFDRLQEGATRGRISLHGDSIQF